MDELNQSAYSKKNSVNAFKESKRIVEEKQLQIDELQIKYSQIEEKLLEYEKNKRVEKSTGNSINKGVNDSVQKKNQRIYELEEILSQKNEEILGMKLRQNELESEIENYEKNNEEAKENLKGAKNQEENEKGLLDLEELKDERDQLKEAMNEAINQCAVSLVKQQNLEKENQKLLKQVENLANSKLLMQNTLADQINSLRGQVQRLKEEKNERSIKISNE